MPAVALTDRPRPIRRTKPKQQQQHPSPYDTAASIIASANAALAVKPTPYSQAVTSNMDRFDVIQFADLTGPNGGEWIRIGGGSFGVVFKVSDA